MELKYATIVTTFISSLLLAGCETTKPVNIAANSQHNQPEISTQNVADTKASASTAKISALGAPHAMYKALEDNGFHIPAVDVKQLKPEHIRQIVSYKTNERPGSVIVDQNKRYLYFVLENNKAVRYAVGVGPASRNFQGTATIAYKQAWPRWTPTQSMIKRNPKHYARYKDGVKGGPGNPMGARALYIYQDGKDTYYRVHGTNAPESIGKAVSAGCIRLLPQDIIDLHKRVKPGATIIIR